MKSSTILLAVLLLTIPLKSQNIVINEVMSLNVDALSDEDGEYPDWLELYNLGSTPLDLTGYGLSDDPDSTMKWILPFTIIEPHQFATVFASAKDKGLWANHIETIINWGDVWKYRLGDSAPSAGWYQINFDDSGWLSGQSGFGFSDEDDSTRVPQVVSVYVRKEFYINASDSITGALLHVDYDDGFVAYLNGWEIARANIGTIGTPPEYNETAILNHEALIYQGLPPELFVIKNASEKLEAGKNVLAVQVHNSDSLSSDLSLIPFLSLGMYEEPDNPSGVAEMLKANLPAYHTNFKIRSDGEPLTLADTSGRVVDRVDATRIQGNVSIGRYPDGGGRWLFFPESTPGSYF